MAKLSANQERSRAKADSSNVPKQSKKIASTFPDRTTAPAIEQFIKSATIAVERYLALLPSAKPRSRRHRKAAQSGSTAPPNRPSDAQRRALVGDIYDAYLTARNEDAAARGFKSTADAVLEAAGLSISITDHDLATIRSQIRPFTEHLRRQGK